MSAYLFWLIIFCFVYLTILYPVALLVISRFRRNIPRKKPFEPTVSLLVAAYNEEMWIEEKILNSLDLDYPADKLEILVASDGSTDATGEIAMRYREKGIKVFDFTENRGKVAILNELVAQSGGEIVMFTDCNAMFNREAVRELTANFSDERVGGVCGKKTYLPGEKLSFFGRSEAAFLKWDLKLKEWESLIHSCVTANGSIYAIRRSLYRPIERPSVPDDFLISTRVVAAGYRLVFEPKAYSVESASGSGKTEFTRKARFVHTGLNGLFDNPSLLNPFRYGWYSWILWSHKALRRIVPPFFFLLPLLNLFLLGNPFYNRFFLIQVLFYLTAFAGWRAESSGKKLPRFLNMPYYATTVHLAAVTAWYRLLRGKRLDRWDTIRS